MADDPKRYAPPDAEQPTENAVARFLRTDPAQFASAHDRVRAGQSEVDRQVDERRDSIRRGARRSPARFRL